MKRLIIFLLAFISMTVNAAAQTSIEEVLHEVEQNNTTLVALKQRVNAETIGNKTDLSLPNPEVEFNYLFGSPSSIGNRTDISVTQGFDFPTVYGRKGTSRFCWNMNGNRRSCFYRPARFVIN